MGGSRLAQGSLAFGGEPDASITLELAGAEVRLWPNWIDPREADGLLHALHKSIDFEQHRLRLFGRAVDAPRLSCWIGDPRAYYRYSGATFAPHPWPPLLAQLRERVEAACDARFNSVLANLYRDGRDAMGWHSDDEDELGAAPVIASVSLGGTRRFRMRPRHGSAPARTLELTHGSLLCMSGETQTNYMHAVPRTRRPVTPRLNLTFRWVEPGKRDFQPALGIAGDGRR